jgi:condensin complex subunit 3
MAAKSASVLDRLQELLAAIFDQAQLSLANHRKNCVALYKLHHQAGTITQLVKNDTVLKLVGERKFGDVFIGLVNRVLVVKKGPATADRIVRFVGSYVKFMNEKGALTQLVLAHVRGAL